MNFVSKRILKAAFALNAVFFACVCAAEMTMMPSFVEKFELPQFDDSYNKVWEIFGDSAKFANADVADVLNMRMNFFDKSTGGRRATITSSQANVNLKTRMATSRERIFAKGQEFDLVGKTWSWNGPESTLSIYSDVVINFIRTPKSGEQKSDFDRTRVSGDASRLVHEPDKNTFFVDGRVKVSAEDLAVDCDSLNAVSENSDSRGRDVSVINAIGNVTVVRENRIARAKRAAIYPRTQESTLEGDAEIVDVPSKAKLFGDKIALLKEKKSLRAFSSPDRSVRARAEFLHAEESGGARKIKIESDEILLVSEAERSRFEFSGNVRVWGQTFTAECGKITVFASAKKESKPEVQVIMCRDRVKLNNDDGEARAEAMDIFPKDSKIALWNSVTLVNASDGTALYSDRLELFRDENAGSATAKKGGKVRLEIAEKTVNGVAGAEFGAKEKGKTGKSGGREGSAPSVVESRALFFARNADGAKFSFDRDVSIRSQSMKGTCNKMNVYSKSRKDNSSRIVKVEAFGDVRISQNEYSAFAEEAVVYPKDQDLPADKAHKFVELLTSKDKPQRRPRILLPPVKNLGFDGENVRAPKNVKMTVVKSDRQRLVSEGKTEKYYFDGNVEMSATQTDGSCGKMEVLIAPPDRVGRRQIAEIGLSDSVKITQQSKEITCGRAQIFVRDELAVLTQDPIIVNKEDNSRVAGSRIIYNKGSRRITVDDDAPAAQGQYEDDDFEEVEKKRPTVILPEFNSEKSAKKEK